MTQCARPSAPRATCDLIGSAAAAVTFIDSARTSSACAVNAPNCLRQRAACSSAMCGEVLGARQALGQVKARIDVTAGNIDDLAVERDRTLAGSVEGPLERRHGCIESIPRAVRGLAGLCQGLLGEGANTLRTAVSRPRWASWSVILR